MITTAAYNRYNYDQKPVTYEDLMTLYDDLTVVEDSQLLRLLTTSGKYILTRVNNRGEIEHPRLDLTGPLTLDQMYLFLLKMWLQAFMEEEDL
jgi:hypothetical protein